MGKGLGGAGTVGSSWEKNKWRGYSLANTATFVGGEKEGAVFYDRSAKSAPKLILIRFRFFARNAARLRQAIPVAIEYGVPEKLVQVSMTTVGSRLCYNFNHRAGC